MAPDQRTNPATDALFTLLRGALAPRHRHVASLATGRTLDLGSREGARSLYANADELVVLGKPDAPIDDVDALVDGEPFDSIVSVARFPLMRDPRSVIRALVDHLADDGRLYFLEPVRRPGTAGSLLRAASIVGAAASGVDFDRDVAADIRAAGLTIIDIDRFEVPTAAWTLRPFIQGIARRPTAPLD